MKILVIGEQFSTNLGDGVIVENVCYLLRRLYPDAIIQTADISGRSAYPAKTEEANQDTTPPRRWRMLLNKVKRAVSKVPQLRVYLAYQSQKKNPHLKKIDASIDVAVFAGGQLFRDYFCVPIDCFVRELSKHRIPVIFNACGYSGINSRLEQRILSRALENTFVRSISMRESLDRVRTGLMLNSSKLLLETCDPALWSGDSFQMSPQPQQEKIGIGVMKTGDRILDGQISQVMLSLIEKLDRDHLSWELFTNGGQEDYLEARRISRLVVAEDSTIVKRPETPQELVASISSYTRIASCRLHSHIIAVSAGIPSIAFVWDDKLVAFFNSINKPSACFLPPFSDREVYQALMEARFDVRDLEHLAHMKEKLIIVLQQQVTGALEKLWLN